MKMGRWEGGKVGRGCLGASTPACVPICYYVLLSHPHSVSQGSLPILMLSISRVRRATCDVRREAQGPRLALKVRVRTPPQPSEHPWNAFGFSVSVSVAQVDPLLVSTKWSLSTRVSGVFGNANSRTAAL